MLFSVLRRVANARRAARMGRAGRVSVEQRFSLSAMVSAYQGLYEAQLYSARPAH